MIALMVADRSPDISKVILNLTSSHPAEAVWTWDKINPGFKQDLQRQHITLNELRRLWDPIAPTNNIGHLKGKQILIYLAKHDRLAPYDRGIELVNKVEQAGYNFRLVINQHGGHILAGFYNLVNANTYLSFLRNKEKHDV